MTDDRLAGAVRRLHHFHVAATNFWGRRLRVPLPAASGLPALLLLFRPFCKFAVRLGRLGDLCQVHLPWLRVFSWSRLLIAGSLIRRRAWTQRSGNPRAKIATSLRVRLTVRKQVVKTGHSPAVGAPESAPRRPRCLAIAFNLILCEVTLTTAETRRELRNTFTSRNDPNLKAEWSQILKLKGQVQLQNKDLKTVGVLGSIWQVSAYILRLWSRSPGPTATQLRSTVIVPFYLGLRSCRLPIGWLKLVTGPGAAGKEPPAKAASVWCVATAFDWYATRTGYISCFRALQRE